MKRILTLLLTTFILSFAACTKNNNSVAPFFDPPRGYKSFKGGLNDANIKVYLPFLDSKQFTMIYRGIVFNVIEEDHSLFANVCYFTATNGSQLMASGKLHFNISSGYLNSLYYSSGYLEFDPGSVFESKLYSWKNNNDN